MPQSFICKATSSQPGGKQDAICSKITLGAFALLWPLYPLPLPQLLHAGALGSPQLPAGCAACPPATLLLRPGGLTGRRIFAMLLTSSHLPFLWEEARGQDFKVTSMPEDVEPGEDTSAHPGAVLTAPERLQLPAGCCLPLCPQCWLSSAAHTPQESQGPVPGAGSRALGQGMPGKCCQRGAHQAPLRRGSRKRTLVHSAGAAPSVCQACGAQRVPAVLMGECTSPGKGLSLARCLGTLPWGGCAGVSTLAPGFGNLAPNPCAPPGQIWPWARLRCEAEHGPGIASRARCLPLGTDSNHLG